MNEQQYYDRMDQSVDDKLKVLDHLPNSGNFLDFGAGTGSIAPAIQSYGMVYYAYDESKQSYEQLIAKGLTILTKIDLLSGYENFFDVIYLSSVFHEIYSINIEKYDEENKIKGEYDTYNYIFGILGRLLKKNGKIIIRDWPGVSENAFVLKNIKIREDHIESFAEFFLIYKNKEIFKNFKYQTDDEKIRGNYLYFDKSAGVLTASQSQLYEMILHYNWSFSSGKGHGSFSSGKEKSDRESWNRESNEYYGGFSLKFLLLYLYNGPYKINSYDEYFQEDYTDHLNNFMELSDAEGFVNTFFNTKMMLVVEKIK